MSGQIFNHHYDFVNQKHVLAMYKGIKEDFRLLYREFSKQNDLQIHSFVKVWSDLKFSSIYGYRHTISELVEFTEGIMHYTKGYIFAENKVSNVFGIFLALAIHSTTPVIQPATKIRLTLGEIKNLRQIARKLDDNSCEYARIVIKFLIENSVFVYVVTELEAGMEFGTRKYFGGADTVTDHAAREDIDTPSMPFDSSLLGTFEEVLGVYSKNKKLAFSKYELAAQREDGDAFSTSSSNFLGKMRQYLNELSEGPSQSENDVEEDEELVDDPGTGTSLDIGNHRRSTKNKAFKREVADVRSNAKKGKDSSNSTEVQKKRVKRSKALICDNVADDDDDDDEIL